jgi:glycerol-3-phosphate dehydrogenase
LWELSRQRLDVLVIGGGATGAGVAREAALRGLTVALVDRYDFGWGTSSRSSRLIHGGLRYLEQRRWHLVRESLAERAVLLRLAPHLVRPLAFIFPVFKRDRVPRWKLEVGLTLYDLLASRGNVPRHRALSKRAVLDHEPLVRDRGLTGGVMYWDAQCDDARLTLATVRAAVAKGALAANYACVTALEIGRRKVSGAVVEDQLGGTQATVAARVIVNATGPWCDGLRRLEDPRADPLIRPTRGAHVMVPRARIGHHHAITFLSPIDGRVMFVLPWGDKSYIGTTDTDAPAEPDRVAASEEDVQYLLRSANAIFPGARLSPDDVSLTWAALRPLLASGDGRDPSARSREHRIETGPRGMLTVVGGKLTTYRLMAVEVVDRVMERLGAEVPRRRGKAGADPSATTALPGGEPFDRDAALREGVRLELTEPTIAHLVGHYGSETPALYSLVRSQPDLKRPLHPHHGSIAAQVVFAVRHELARRLDDVITRRLGLAYETADVGEAAAPAVARIMAAELGWDETRREAEIERYAAIVRAIPRGRGLSSD